MNTRSRVTALIDLVQRAADAAAGGPWHVRYAEDEYTAGAAFISTIASSASDEREWADASVTVAITHLQGEAPGRVGASGANAEFIVVARNQANDLRIALMQTMGLANRLGQCASDLDRALAGALGSSTENGPVGRVERGDAAESDEMAEVDPPLKSKDEGLSEVARAIALHSKRIQRGLDELQTELSYATEGPWFVRVALDDDDQELQYVASESGGGTELCHPRGIVAITRQIGPSAALVMPKGWNHAFICAARSVLPQVCADAAELVRAIDRLLAFTGDMIQSAGCSRGAGRRLVDAAVSREAEIRREWGPD